MSLDTPSRGTGRKKPSRDYVLKRAAIAAVSSSDARLGHLQARAAHLLAIGQKLRATGRHDPRYIAEAESLLASATREQRELDARIASLPENVRLHSTIRDTERALGMVTARLSEARALLLASPRSSFVPRGGEDRSVKHGRADASGRPPGLRVVPRPRPSPGQALRPSPE